MQIPIPLIAIAGFGSAALLVLVIFELTSSAWQRYEEEVLKGAEVSFDQIYLNIPARQLLYIAVVLFILFMGLGALLFGRLIVGVLVGALAFASPRLLFIFLKGRREKKFGRQLVEAMMNISNALRSGFSLPQAFELIQREMEQPISQEFRLINQETRVGVPMEEALGHALDRMPSEDFDLVITAILVSQEVGGSLAEVMDNIARTIRERHQIEGKIKALTAQGRMQAWILGMVPIALGFVLNWLNPTLFEPMLKTWIGWMLLAIIGVLLGMGMLVVRKIVMIEV